MTQQQVSKLKPSIRLGWNKYSLINVFGFFSKWKWQQTTRHGYTIRIGWFLVMVGTPAPNEPFVDVRQPPNIEEESDRI